NTKRRYSARAAISSGSTTITAAPTTGASVQPAPPTITASRNKIDCENGKLSGATKANSAANKPPATPVNAADSAKAMVFTTTGLKPTARAATSESRTASIAMPQELEARR